MASLFWADQVARKVRDTEKRLKRTKVIRTEMGMGASGIPHVGSVGDGVRSYAVTLALKSLGLRSDFIAFSDNLDGLRKVPAGFPKTLEKDIGKSVALIKDPYRCHKSFGAHMSSLLIDAFDKLGLTYKVRLASEEYTKGTFDKEIIDILNNAELAGQIIEETTHSKKFLKQLPFLPICKKCGKIYTTRAYEWLAKEKKIRYACDQEFEGKNSTTGKTILVKGCGYEGISTIHDGKLAWKVEFAARWRALNINYEAYGKDIGESVICNDRICREILKWEPPVHSYYEMFNSRDGAKISKSAGNVFTPQVWLSYANKESLRLLFLKKLNTTRTVDTLSIPAYVDEVDQLDRIYSGDLKVKNPKELAHLKRLYDYVNFMQKPRIRVNNLSHSLLTSLTRLLRDKKTIILALQTTGHLPKQLSKAQRAEVGERLAKIADWVRDSKPPKPVKMTLSANQKRALATLANELKKRWTEKALLTRLYEIAKENNLSSQAFFRASYYKILGAERGPRLAPFILAIGQSRVRKLLLQ